VGTGCYHGLDKYRDCYLRARLMLNDFMELRISMI